MYQKAVSDFLIFVKKCFPEHVSGFPCLSYQVTYYIAFLSQSGLGVSTIKSRISALNYVHKLCGGSDLYHDFILKKCLIGLAKSHATIDMRLPITLPILIQLCRSLCKLYSNSYFIALMHAMFSLAFVAFLRVGEITKTGSSYNPNLLCIHNISVCSNPPSLNVSFQHYKHKTPGPPFTLTVTDLPQMPVVQFILTYIKLRGPAPGPLFLYKGVPVTRNLFVQTLNSCLKFLNLNHLPYKSHSFRIGAASYAISNGVSYDKVKIMGRWKSDALAKYIRVNAM